MEDDDGSVEASDTHASGSEYNVESESDSEADRQNMGPGGGAVSDADKRVIAKYVASFGREWAAMTYKDRWDPFEAMVDHPTFCLCTFAEVWSSTQYPQRSAKSWAEVHRRFGTGYEGLSLRARCYNSTARVPFPDRDHANGEQVQEETSGGSEISDRTAFVGFTELTFPCGQTPPGRRIPSGGRTVLVETNQGGLI